MPPAYQLPCGGQLTFEPGAQIEHSTSVHATAAGALDDIERIRAELRGLFARHGVLLAAGGIDLWNSVDDVPQQLRAPRYGAMASFFDQIGPHGRTMMRHTSSIQINLDLGRAPEERWLVANLASPVLTAAFSTSPGVPGQRGAACARAVAWQELDPTRTGFPPALVDGSLDDPGEQFAEMALDANVMLIRTADGGAVPGTPGFTLRDWITAGHPEHGRPTLDDVAYHMTTLFPEVRPRGFLELRAPDGLPIQWTTTVAVLFCGLVYDDEARGCTLDRLERYRSRLPELWRNAADRGLADPELAELARVVWCCALEGAERLPVESFRGGDIDTARRFLERYTLTGRAPAEELRELYAAGPERALAWASGVAAAHEC